MKPMRDCAQEIREAYDLVHLDNGILPWSDSDKEIFQRQKGGVINPKRISKALGVIDLPEKTEDEEEEEDPLVKRDREKSTENVVLKTPGVDMKKVIAPETFIDGRGGWQVFFTLADRVIEKLIAEMTGQLMGIFIGNTETLQDFRGLYEIMVHMKACTVDGMSEARIDYISKTIEVPPFWYKYGKGLTSLRSVIEMVKAAVRDSVAESGKSIDSQANILNIALQSTKYIFAGQLDGKHQDKSAIRTHQNATVKIMKTLFNLPDHPLCRKLTGVTMPNIKNSKTLYIPRYNQEGEQVEWVTCRMICNRDFSHDFDLTPYTKRGIHKNARKSYSSPGPPGSRSASSHAAHASHGAQGVSSRSSSPGVNTPFNSVLPVSLIASFARSTPAATTTATATGSSSVTPGSVTPRNLAASSPPAPVTPRNLAASANPSKDSSPSVDPLAPSSATVDPATVDPVASSVDSTSTATTATTSSPSLSSPSTSSLPPSLSSPCLSSSASGLALSRTAKSPRKGKSVEPDSLDYLKGEKEGRKKDRREVKEEEEEGRSPSYRSRSRERKKERSRDTNTNTNTRGSGVNSGGSLSSSLKPSTPKRHKRERSRSSKGDERERSRSSKGDERERSRSKPRKESTTEEAECEREMGLTKSRRQKEDTAKESKETKEAKTKETQDRKETQKGKEGDSQDVAKKEEKDAKEEKEENQKFEKDQSHTSILCQSNPHTPRGSPTPEISCTSPKPLSLSSEKKIRLRASHDSSTSPRTSPREIPCEAFRSSAPPSNNPSPRGAKPTLKTSNLGGSLPISPTKISPRKNNGGETLSSSSWAKTITKGLGFSKAEDKSEPKAPTPDTPSKKKSDKNEKKTKSDMNIILHFHGGGFVAGSPQFHETYLRDWAIQTKSVIFSVDYSLAPTTKFPVSLEQCYAVYKWIVSPDREWNMNSTKIILAGDSAGGNFVFTVCYRAIQDGIRIPDGLLSLYPAMNLVKTVRCSPSRVMFFHDVFVPIPFLFLCLECYVPPGVDSTNYFCSPLYAPEEVLKKLPEIHILSAAYDPLLDDSINFTRRLDKLGVPYNHQIYYLPHGFLNFAVPFVPGAMEAKEYTIKLIKKMFAKPDPVSPPETTDELRASPVADIKIVSPEKKDPADKTAKQRPKSLHNPNPRVAAYLTEPRIAVQSPVEEVDGEEDIRAPRRRRTRAKSTEASEPLATHIRSFSLQ
eukprot:TRINITY_DN4791_c0_g1_i2.p1 TRINITY_DN4791_c0_g1~~TRINITY_DN4791_c0_g1_i2.p1  ORF type:complete len:1344 (+),score=280.05 TRINITY_DN4791_c0_g1_i2:419-4033(+)